MPSLMDALRVVLRPLHRMDDQCVIIDGIAVTLLGRRLTADTDAVVLLSLDQLAHLVEIVAEEGLITRISDAVDFAHQHRVLLLQHLESGIPVDISRGSVC